MRFSASRSASAITHRFLVPRLAACFGPIGFAGRAALTIGLLALTAGTAQASDAAVPLPPSPPSATTLYLRATLHVRAEVAQCADALTRAIRGHASKRYDRLLQLDRYQLHATLRHQDAIFSISKPVPVDLVVTMKASARVRGHWQWEPVITRCGLRRGHVVATSVAPRHAPSSPRASSSPRPSRQQQQPQPGADYVDANPWHPI